MRLADIRIGVSPLSDRVYLGTVTKKDPGCWSSKEDCTGQFIRAIMDWIPAGTTRLVEGRAPDGVIEYEIEVRVKPKPTGGLTECDMGDSYE